MIDTPAAVVDLDRLERNLSRWQSYCDDAGLRSRPHVKTHKCVEIARMQVDLGARGITCQKLGEAEVMVAGGVRDVLVSYNLLGDAKLARLRALLDRAAITVTVDDTALLPGLSAAAADAPRALRVLVDCDTGLGRTGVADPEAAADLATAVAGAPGLQFAGFFTHPCPDGAVAFLAEAARLARARGLDIEVVSVGGTPGMWASGQARPVATEYRVGTYVFHDRSTVEIGRAHV